MHRALPSDVEQWTDDRIDASRRLATAGMTRAREEIESALGEPDGGAIVVCGPTGYGKSLLLRSLLARPPGPYFPRFLPFAHVEPGDLVSFVSRWLVPSSSAVGSSALDEDPMARLLGADPGSGRQVLLLLDEIQSIPHESLRRLLDLCNEHGAAFVGAGLAGPAFETLLSRQPRKLRRIGLTEPWSRQDAALLLDRVAAGAGFEENRLEAAVDLDSVVRAASGNPRMVRAELGARLRTTDLFSAEPSGVALPRVALPGVERHSNVSLLPVREPHPEGINAGDVTERAAVPAPSCSAEGVPAAKPMAAPRLVPPRTDWVRPREALAPSVSPRPERASPLLGLRDLARAAQRRLALFLRRSTPRRETWEAARHHSRHVFHRAITFSAEAARTLEGHWVGLQGAGLARARRSRAGAARLARLAGDSLRAGAARLRAAWILAPRASVGVIGGCVLLVASILVSAGRHSGGGEGSLERSAGAVTSLSVRALPEPDRRLLVPVAAAPPAAVVQLRINAMPWGIVTVDGRSLGSTPTSVDVSPGPHRVRVELSDGRVIEEQTIVGEEGSQLAFH